MCYRLAAGGSFCQHWPVRLQVYESEYTSLGGHRDHYRSSCRSSCWLSLGKDKETAWEQYHVAHLVVAHAPIFILNSYPSPQLFFLLPRHQLFLSMLVDSLKLQCLLLRFAVEQIVFCDFWPTVKLLYSIILIQRINMRHPPPPIPTRYIIPLLTLLSLLSPNNLKKR